MPSHLTRVVFRNITANKPLLYRGCLYRTSRPRIIPHNGLRAYAQPQQRTFLDLFKPQRKIKDAAYPPGLEKMVEVAQMQDMAVRPPPVKDVVEAFKKFFAQKERTFEDFHIRVARIAYKYIAENPKEGGQPWLELDDLRKAFRVLIRAPSTGGKQHLQFGRILHEDLLRRQGVSEKDETNDTGVKKLELDTLYDLGNFVRILCQYGASLEARTLAQETFVGPLNQGEEFFQAVWSRILFGLSKEGKGDELIGTVDMIRNLSIPFTPAMQSALVTYFAGKKDLNQAKYWYMQPTFGKNGSMERDPSGTSSAAILRLCARKGDLSFGQQVVASLLKNTPSKSSWDAVFLWSAAIGKGVDEVDRMMSVMVRRNEELHNQDPSQVVRSDIDTINDLVEFSMSKQDPYSAERYIALGDKRGILPNARTFLLQMQYRLSVKDVDGARAAYYGLHGIARQDEESVGPTNKLVRAMCESEHFHFDDIMSVIEDMHAQKIPLEPKTVAALCLLHLRRGELHDAVDILQVHSYQYSPEQRVVIRDSLLRYLLDRKNSTADAWDTYQILRNVFGETNRAIRTQIMNEFFARKRSDMACHVFFHMRDHPHPSIAASRDVYVAAFTGFARNADAESLELAHNQLKLDLNVEPDTKLRNALMLAYAAIDENTKALDYWAEIAASKEGPTYNSIAIAFRACEGMPFGDEHAKPIWRRLKAMDIDIDKEIFTAYIDALARNQLHDEVVGMLETVEADYGFTPDLHMLGSWYNATANSERQDKVEAWIKEHYPNFWDELESLGHTVTMDGFGYKQYNINRDLEP